MAKLIGVFHESGELKAQFIKSLFGSSIKNNSPFPTISYKDDKFEVWDYEEEGFLSFDGDYMDNIKNLDLCIFLSLDRYFRCTLFDVLHHNKKLWYVLLRYNECKFRTLKDYEMEVAGKAEFFYVLNSDDYVKLYKQLPT
jgi:hypothetical protein